MRSYGITLILVFIISLTCAWKWGLDNRLSYLSRDYSILTGKELLLKTVTDPSLIVFGDSTAMDGVQPEKLGPQVINMAMSGCTPIESYFMVRQLLQTKIRPQAVILSYNAYHFVHPDFYWENSVKFGLIHGSDADEVLGLIYKYNDKELIPQDKKLVSGSGLWNTEEHLYSFLFSRGLPSYFMSSLFADRFGVRKKENEQALALVAQTRGQYYFPLSNGSKSLNADTRLTSFTISPVVDHYFQATLDLLQKENIPAYFYAMPINESSVPHLNKDIFKAYKGYLEGLAQKNPDLHILGSLWTVYPWRLYSDYAHLNEKGTQRFNPEFAKTLNKAHVPGGPYGSLSR